MTHAAPLALALSEDLDGDLAAYLPPSTTDALPSPITTTTATATSPANCSLSEMLTALHSTMRTRVCMSASTDAVEFGAIRHVVAGLRMQLQCGACGAY